MAKFQVTYETTVKPSASSLPAGATIKQTSALPFKTLGLAGILSDSGTLRVEKSTNAQRPAILSIGTYSSVKLTPAQVRELREALAELV